MAWPSIGTIDVTNGSTAVTGTGTNWVATLKAGWAMIMPNGLPYELASINSDTGVTLAKAYEGSTQTGQAYSVMPIQGLEANLVTALNDLLANYQGVYDGVGQGKFTDGTVTTPAIRFAGDEDTGLYRPASNQLGAAVGGVQRTLLSSTEYLVDVPITGTAVQSIATDTTAGRLLPVGAFGLGGGAPQSPTGDLNGITASGLYAFETSTLNRPPATNGTVVHIARTSTIHTQLAISRASDTLGRMYVRAIDGNAWSAWREVYHQGSILGAVSQSGGVPAGAVIERGSNANGEYVRFADGTQICTSVFDVTFGQTYALIKEWTFPAAFVTGGSGNLVFSFAQNQAESSTTPSPNSLVGYDIGTPTTSNVQVRLRRVSGGSDFVAGDAAKTTAIVMGRWF